MITEPNQPLTVPEEYAHIYRRKTRLQLIRISAAVMGIEFCYAAETAFVSPALLNIGISHAHMTLIWCLSPLVGFFLTPLLGSLSDRCHLRLGRRRPFILALSVGIILGLLLVPNGKDLGIAMGDRYPATKEEAAFLVGYNVNVSSNGLPNVNNTMTVTPEINATDHDGHPWSIFFTVIGTVLLDFDADACQSPSRAYMLDVTVADDHAIGLSTFTIMAGLGGSMGYAMGAINWDSTTIGHTFGGHVRSVFTVIIFIFIGCVAITICSFTEIPLNMLKISNREIKPETPGICTDAGDGYHQEITDHIKGNKICALSSKGGYKRFSDDDDVDERWVESDDVPNERNASRKPNNYGAILCDDSSNNETSFIVESDDSGHSAMTRNAGDMGIKGPGSKDISVNHLESISKEEPIQLKHYLSSIIHLPKSLRILCLTNLFCWMSIVSYSLYFTDFVGEVVFNGDPAAPVDSPNRQLYEEGIRYGCWGMAVYSLSCAAYSFLIDKLISIFRTKPVYVGGQLVYSIGMLMLAITRHRLAVIILSSTTGIMYATVFTMPYILVAQYHTRKIFDTPGQSKNVRGIGTDVAVVSSMIFLAQFILSACMGAIVNVTGSTLSVVVLAAILSFCGAICATQVTYFNG